MAKFDFKKAGMKILGIGAGAVGGEVLSAKLLPKMDPALRGGLKIAAGAFGPTFMKGKGSDLVSNIGDGLIASGAIELAKKFIPDLVNPVSTAGVGLLPEKENYVIDEDFEQVADVNGPGEEAALSGTDESALSGMDDEDIEDEY